jgi:hypothetical protein
MEGLVLTGIAAKLLYDIAGPVAKEISEMIKDEMRPYRAVREARLAEKTVAMVQKAGFQPKSVSPKILLSAFENAGMEEDEDLHTMWAALLANAANPLEQFPMPHTFVELLKQLSPAEAKYLQAIYGLLSYSAGTAAGRRIGNAQLIPLGTGSELFLQYRNANLSRSEGRNVRAMMMKKVTP